MKRTIIALSIALASGSVFAGEQGYGYNRGGQGLQVRSTSVSGAGAESGSASFNQLNIGGTTIPADTTVRTAPSVAVVAPAMMSAASGPCLGVSETKSGGVTLSLIGGGGGIAAGEGKSYLDWGCEQERAIRTGAGILATPGMNEADKKEVSSTIMTIFRQMGPVQVAQGKSKAPTYAAIKPEQIESNTQVAETPVAAPIAKPVSEVVATPVKPQEKIQARPIGTGPELTEMMVGNDRWIFRNGQWEQAK